MAYINQIKIDIEIKQHLCLGQFRYECYRKIFTYTQHVIRHIKHICVSVINLTGTENSVRNF
jgi:hypothetical protein